MFSHIKSLILTRILLLTSNEEDTITSNKAHSFCNWVFVFS